MKKAWVMNRLLAPHEMVAMKAEALDQMEDRLSKSGCCGRLAWEDHACTSRYGQPVEWDYYEYLEFDHWIEQSWIKNDYSLGGVAVADSGYRPIKPGEHLEPEITAPEIAKDVRTGLILCEGLHKQRPRFKPEKRMELLRAAELVSTLKTAAAFYSLSHRLDRSFDYRWKDLAAI